MAWPTVAELKQRLNVESDDWDDQLTRLLAGAISITKERIGDWVEDYDQPDEQIAPSALELAVELASSQQIFAGSDRFGVSHVIKSELLLLGRRRRFHIG